MISEPESNTLAKDNMEQTYCAGLRPWTELSFGDALTDKEHGSMYRRAAVASISDEMCRALGLEIIPHHLLPVLYIDPSDMDQCSYSSLWRTKFDQPHQIQDMPIVSVGMDAPSERFIEEIAAFVLEYYRTKADPSDDWTANVGGHPKQVFTSTPLYDVGSAEFTTTSHHYTHLSEADAFAIFRAGLAAELTVARAAASLVLRGEVSKVDSPFIAYYHQDEHHGVVISGKSWLPVAPITADIVVAELPPLADAIKIIKTHSIINVLKNREKEFAEFLLKTNEILKEHGGEIPSNIQVLFPDAISSVRYNTFRWLAETVGDACAARIMKTPETVSEFRGIAFAAHDSVTDWMDRMVAFATESEFEARN